MRKLFLPIIIGLTVVLSACGSSGNKGTNDEGGKPAQSSSNSNSSGANGAAEGNNSQAPSNTGDQQTGTRIYQAEEGPVEVPANPQRVVVLTRFLTGNVLALGVPVVGVDDMSKENPRFEEQLKDVEVISDESLEKIMELEPDLIVGLDGVKNLDKLKQIAPTVVYTYDKVDYLTQQIEVGKLLNKEQEARDWVDGFKARAQKAGEEIRAKIGEDATVSVIETFNKQLYVYGDNFGRGTEILYQEFKMKMPEKVKEATSKDGYMALSTEVLNDYLGDYVIFSKNAEEDASFQNTELYKNLPAVKNNHVYEADAKTFYFRDPLSLDYQLDFFIESFLGK